MRIDTHLEEGSTISPYYDSLIAKLVVWAEDRPAAIARGVRALEEIEIDGVPTTRGLAIDILRSDEFGSGEYTTSFLAEMEGRLPALAMDANEPRRSHDRGPHGSIRIEGDALSGLVITSAELVEGARVRRPRRGLDVSVIDGTAKVELELAARYGVALPTVAREVQTNVAAALLRSAGLAAAVDVSIEELDL